MRKARAGAGAAGWTGAPSRAPGVSGAPAGGADSGLSGCHSRPVRKVSAGRPGGAGRCCNVSPATIRVEDYCTQTLCQENYHAPSSCIRQCDRSSIITNRESDNRC